MYGDRAAVDNVDLAVGEEGILGVIGASGAGKTTLLKLLAGLEAPTSGRILYREEPLDAEKAKALRREATMLFQTPLFLRGDVHSNVAYGLRLRGVEEDKIRGLVEAALGRVRLPGFGARNASALSGGEAQRVSLARALVLDPKVLLLDEPTSNLDPSNAAIISDIISEESKARAIVLATHDYGQVRRLARSVIHMEAGRVVGRGETSELFSSARYADNVFTGDARMEGGVCLVEVGGATIAAAFDASGRISVRISPEDIFVSRAPVETSARNQLKGRITSVEESGSVIRLRVDASRDFSVQLTKRSLSELGLNVGGEVYLSFKASSVELI